MRWQCVNCHQAKARQDEAIAKQREKEMRRGAAAAAAPLSAATGSAAAARPAPSHAALFSFSQCLPTSFTFYVRFTWPLAVIYGPLLPLLLRDSPNPSRCASHRRMKPTTCACTSQRRQAAIPMLGSWATSHSRTRPIFETFRRPFHTTYTSSHYISLSTSNKRMSALKPRESVP